MTRPLTVVDLFAGAGGAALGLKAAGLEHLLCVEKDPRAVATLERAGFPVLAHDLRQPFPFELHPSPDVVWASPPCQAWSTAGKREGAKDPRNGWPWTWDRVDELRPRWLLCENVKGMLMHSGGADSCCGGRVDECAACYWHEVVIPEALRRFSFVDFRVLTSSDYGVPQHRERVYLVCGPQPFHWPVATHADPKMAMMGLLGSKPWVSAGEALGLTGGAIEPLGKPEWAKDLGGPAPTIGTKGNAYLVMRRGRSGPGEGTTDERRSVDEPSVALSGAGGGSTRPLLEVAGKRRPLTTAECARLMSFPDGYPFQGNQKQRNRQVGNACTPPVVEALARRVRNQETR